MKSNLPPAYTADKIAINVVIETPRNSRNKFTYDKATGMYKLKKILPLGLSFPCDFGFVPRTRAADGDPLDVMVFMDSVTYPGCYLECRLLGILKGTQQEGKVKPFRNDRLLAVPVEMKDMEHIKKTGDLGKQKLDALVHFIMYYNKMEDKIYKLIGFGEADEAHRLLKKNKTR